MPKVFSEDTEDLPKVPKQFCSWKLHPPCVLNYVYVYPYEKFSDSYKNICTVYIWL